MLMTHTPHKQSNSTLQTLRVGDQTLGDSGVEALCAGIARNKGLLHLDLSFKGGCQPASQGCISC